MALALALEAKVDKSVEHGDLLLIITLLYSLISILGIGTFLGPLLKLLKVSRHPNEKEVSVYQVLF